MNIVKIIICHKSTAMPVKDTGIWEIREILVDKEFYESRSSEKITESYYNENVVFVGIYSWEE